jgi:hypothetical protein
MWGNSTAYDGIWRVRGGNTHQQDQVIMMERRADHTILHFAMMKWDKPLTYQVKGEGKAG